MKQCKHPYFAALIPVLFVSGLIVLNGCTSGTQHNPDMVTENTGPVDLATFKATLPEADGSKLVEANCGICHSLQYIRMQPDLPEKTWEKTVDKMIKIFGAPIPDSSSRSAILKYLVTIRGKN